MSIPKSRYTCGAFAATMALAALAAFGGLREYDFWDGWDDWDVMADTRVIAEDVSHMVNAALAYFSLAAFYRRTGGFGEAIELLNRAVDWRPDYSAAFHNLGEVLYAQGDVGAAVGHFEEALKHDSSNVRALEGLAHVLYNQGRREEAMQRS